MIARDATRLILALAILASSATAGDFPFAKGTFDTDGKLKQWKLEDVRIHCDKAIGDLAGRNSVMEKDDAADPLLIAYLSDAVEGKTFETVLDMSDIQGLVHVAIQVDDHATLTVKEIPDSIQSDGHTPIDQTYELIGTALWNKGRSYKEFPTPIPAGRKYNLKLDYRNTDNLTKQYNGLIDFDGVNVFLMHHPAVDLDVDSNNNEGFVFTWGSPEEDRIEASLDYDQPGKIIAVPLDPDADKDGVPDALDGFDGRGDTLGDTQFVQMVVSIPPNYDPETATVTFAYKMSTLGMTEGASHNESGFRIWTRDAFVRRSTNAIPDAKTEYGYLVRKDEEIPWKKLAAHCDSAASQAYPGPAVILYIETVLVSDANGLISSMPFATKEPISVTAKPNDQDAQLNTSDTVNIAVRCTGGVKLTGPNAIVVNDNDDNNNEQWDKDEDNLEWIDADVKPIKIKAVALDQPVTVTISSEAMKTAGDTGTSTAGGLIGGFYPGLKTITPGATTGSDSDGQSKIGRISVPYTFTVPANTTIIQNLFIDGQRNSATMEDVVIEATIDSSGIEAGTPPCAATTMAEHKLTVYQIDLDIDSNNNEGFTFTDGSDEEDKIEASKTLPGKIIVTSLLSDANGDGIPDYQNGVDGEPVITGAMFTPMMLTLPEPYDPETTTITLSYEEAKLSGTSPSSGLRIWKSDAAAPRATANDLIPNASAKTWVDLFGSAGRKITLYIEVVNAPGSRLTGKKEISVTAEQPEATQTEDTLNISLLLPIDIEEVISDQIAGNEANKLPTAYFGGNPAKPGNGHPNNPMLMATRSGSDARLMIKMNVPAAQAASIRVGVRQTGQTTILNSVVSVPPPGKTPLSFTALSGSTPTKLYEIVAGYDANSNAVLENSEVAVVFEKTPRTDREGNTATTNLHLLDKFIVVTLDDFTAARAVTDGYGTGITINTFYPTAAKMIAGFARGATTITGSSPPESGVLLDASTIPSLEGLSHPLGGKWNTAKQTSTHRLVLPIGSDLSEDVVGSTGLRDMYARALWNHRATIAARATTSWGVVKITFIDNEIDFSASDINDQVHAALGKCNFVGSLEVSCKIKAGGGFDVGGLNCYGAMVDLYDFAFGASKVSVLGIDIADPKEAARTQAGFATLTFSPWPDAGRVFFTKVELETGWFDYTGSYPP